MNNAQRVIAVGDVHGCLDELRDLVDLVGYRVGVDRLVLLGDMVDRGPDPRGVVRVARTELQAEAVLGNHDEKMLRWYRHENRRRELGVENPMREPFPERLAQWMSMSADDLDWLRGLPHSVQLAPGWVGVHAGVEPGIAFEDQKPGTMLRVRYLRADGKVAKVRDWSNVPDDVVYWTEWSGEWCVGTGIVYGHHVHGPVPRTDHGPDGRVRAVGLDTGCCFGDRLSAWVWTPTMTELVSVPARSSYRDPQTVVGELE